MYTQTLQNFSVALKLRPSITRIHFGISFHIQIYQSHWDLYNKNTKLHRNREQSSFFPQSHARRAARALSLKKKEDCSQSTVHMKTTNWRILVAVVH